MACISLFSEQNMDWNPVPLSYDPLKAGSIDGTDDIAHDKGIIRAINSTYKPNKGVNGKPEHTIFVGRLSPNTDEDSLGYVFSDYGEIKKLRLVRDIVTGFSRCYAFIEYFDEDSAYKAQKEADKTVLDEREIYVDFECERCLKGWIPRRLGGGIGGKKESGQLRFGGKNRPFKKPFNIYNTVKPEGDSFRDRLSAVERSEKSRHRNERYTRSDDIKGRDSDSNVHRHRDRRRRSDSGDRSPSSSSRGKKYHSKDRHYRSRSRESYRKH